MSGFKRMFEEIEENASKFTLTDEWRKGIVNT